MVVAFSSDVRIMVEGFDNPVGLSWIVWNQHAFSAVLPHGITMILYIFSELQAAFEPVIHCVTFEGPKNWRSVSVLLLPSSGGFVLVFARPCACLLIWSALWDTRSFADMEVVLLGLVTESQELYGFVCGMYAYDIIFIPLLCGALCMQKFRSPLKGTKRYWWFSM